MENKDLACNKKEIKCYNIIKQYKYDWLWLLQNYYKRIHTRT